MKKISFAITVSTETEEFKKLYNHLIDTVKYDYEVVVLVDHPKVTDELKRFLEENKQNITVRYSIFDGDFGYWKNVLNGFCQGEYIFQIDADEIPHEHLLNVLPQLVDQNEDVDLFYIPRMNVVEGITERDMRQWNWNSIMINNKKLINWPDYQGRLYKNKSSVKWNKKVHEHIIGHEKYGHLPQNEEFSIQHIKTIERQRKQNRLYEELQSNHSD